jgi:hypothetical protein
MRNIVDQNCARAAFGAIASQLRSCEAEFVPQRPRKRLLFHHIDTPLLAVHVDRDETIAGFTGLPEDVGSAEKIASRGDGRSTANDALYEIAPRNAFGCGVEYVQSLIHVAPAFRPTRCAYILHPKAGSCPEFETKKFV